MLNQMIFRLVAPLEAEGYVLPYNPFRGDVNRGKKSSKFNQDCTICRSCREAMTGFVVLE